MSEYRKITTRQIVRIEGIATNLSTILHDWIDMPDSANAALRAHYDGIIAVAAMLRDRDEMIDEINESKP